MAKYDAIIWMLQNSKDHISFDNAFYQGVKSGLQEAIDLLTLIDSNESKLKEDLNVQQ